MLIVHGYVAALTPVALLMEKGRWVETVTQLEDVVNCPLDN
jgi:hypothetical protein